MYPYDRKMIEDYYYTQKIGFSIIKIGQGDVHPKNIELARENGGEYMNVSKENIYPALASQAPLEQQDTKYSGRKNYTVASWIFLSKILPVLLVIILATSR